MITIVSPVVPPNVVVPETIVFVVKTTAFIAALTALIATNNSASVVEVVSFANTALTPVAWAAGIATKTNFLPSAGPPPAEADNVIMPVGPSIDGAGIVLDVAAAVDTALTTLTEEMLFSPTTT